MQPRLVPPDLLSALWRVPRWGEWFARRALEMDFRCAYCDQDMLQSVDTYFGWHLEHIIPLFHSGDETFENITLACFSCNALKHSYIPIGSTREERIADARRHIERKRAERQSELQQVQEIARLARASGTSK